MGILRPVFANPSICKVFHGADNDVLWLQRDFHIYVVNLFDTAKACEVMSKPQKSLAYLLETYCGVSTNKLLQREDWRLRPLTAEMLQYAQTDAHYLLYLADCLVTELGFHKTAEDVNASYFEKSSLLYEVLRRSNTVCLQLYVKDVEALPGDSAASSIFSRYVNFQTGILWQSFDIKELLRQLCAWRDIMARTHDESLRYVLSDQAIIALAASSPKTQEEVYKTIMQADSNANSSKAFSSFSSPSPVVSGHLDDLCLLFQEDKYDPDDVFKKILQKHEENGESLLSFSKYALLQEFTKASKLPKKHGGINAKKRGGCRSSRELFVKKFSCKSPVYHNCRIYASDGRLLCYCDRRKLEWYVLRNLAKLIDEDPPAIMLLFEPKGRPEDEDNEFYIQRKKNICVGCGERNHYLRYRIIPSCYRMHFPEHLKSHRSHDIVLLCVDCHEIAHSGAEKYKKEIATEFDIPLFVRKVVDSGENEAMNEASCVASKVQETGVSPLQLRTAAMALLRHGERMPSKRREELTLIVKEYFGGREISEADMEMALLVGMSLHERRRLEKKKGLSLKHCVRFNSRRFQESTDCISSESSLSETLKGEIKMSNIMEISNEVTYYPPEDAHHTNDSNSGHNFATCDLEITSIVNVNGQQNAIVSNEHMCLNRIVKDENTRDSTMNNTESIISSNNGVNSVLSNEVALLPKVQKLSLLGHGPHGKQVVERILKEHGDDGIREFCQRWRQVFVNSIQPRFLPAGWDVMHSGRREFGEYSVYNPENKGSSAADHPAAN